MSRERPNDLRRPTPPAPGSVSRAGIRRFAANSKTGRRIAAETGRIEQGPGLTREQQEWNAKVEADRQARLERRRARST